MSCVACIRVQINQYVDDNRQTKPNAWLSSLCGGVRSTRAARVAPRGSLHVGRSTRVAPRGRCRHFNTDVRSILILVLCGGKKKETKNNSTHKIAADRVPAHWRACTSGGVDLDVERAHRRDVAFSVDRSDGGAVYVNGKERRRWWWGK